MKFDAVLSPGRIEKIDTGNKFEEMFCEHHIYLTGRYAKWDPDFLVEDIPQSVKEIFSVS